MNKTSSSGLFDSGCLRSALAVVQSTSQKSRVKLLLLLAICSPCATAFAQGTEFVYQGRLHDGAVAANGSYDVASSLWNASSGGAQVGGSFFTAATPVSNGVFTVTLDFGNQFPGAER